MARKREKKKRPLSACVPVNSNTLDVCVCEKSQKGLTSDVLHGDGAGGGEFSGHPEGFVAQLLVHQCAFEERIRKKFSILSSILEAFVGGLHECISARLTSFVCRL